MVFGNFDPEYDDKGNIINYLYQDDSLFAVNAIDAETGPKLSLNTDKVMMTTEDADARDEGQLRIDTVYRAIRENKTSCDSCHTADVAHSDYINKHDMTSQSGCVVCHSDYKQSNNLETFHRNKNVDCMGCHDYQGSKLDPAKVKAAIKNKDLECTACHDDHGNPDHTYAEFNTTKIGGLDIVCSDCHGQPAADVAALPADGGVHKLDGNGNTCLTCHDYDGVNPIVKGATPEERIANVEAAINEHKGFACSNCHEDHGSAEDKHASTSDISSCNPCHLVFTNSLTYVHIERAQLNCLSCHKYNGIKLDPEKVSNAIKNNETACNACHEGHINVDHTSLSDVSNCDSCHSGFNSDVSVLHENIGLDCVNCHNYSGTKLDKTRIDNAITLGNKSCGACHDNMDPDTGGHDIPKIHNVVLIPNGCLNCHNAFAKRYQILIPMNVAQYHADQSNTLQSLNCQTCHNYTGTELDKTVIDAAIASGNFTCGNTVGQDGQLNKGCHENVDMDTQTHSGLDEVHLGSDQ